MGAGSAGSILWGLAHPAGLYRLASSRAGVGMGTHGRIWQAHVGIGRPSERCRSMAGRPRDGFGGFCGVLVEFPRQQPRPSVRLPLPRLGRLAWFGWGRFAFGGFDRLGFAAHPGAS